MNLRELIGRLKELCELEVMVDLPLAVFSYRGYYEDLCFPSTDSVHRPRSYPPELLLFCLGIPGTVYHGYKGGEYTASLDSDLWVAPYGECGKVLSGINDDGSLVLEEEESW
jgi:hypothetical protein